MGRHGPIVGSALGWMLAVGIGCAGDPESRPPPARATSTTSTAAATSTTTRVPATSTTAPLPTPLSSPEDARRLLEQHGVDPAELSREVGEHMRRRFEPRAPE